HNYNIPVHLQEQKAFLKSLQTIRDTTIPEEVLDEEAKDRKVTDNGKEEAKNINNEETEEDMEEADNTNTARRLESVMMEEDGSTSPTRPIAAHPLTSTATLVNPLQDTHLRTLTGYDKFGNILNKPIIIEAAFSNEQDSDNTLAFLECCYDGMFEHGIT